MSITEIGNGYWNNVYESSYATQKNDMKSQNETMRTDAKRMAEQPVKLSISDEGKEHYRNSIQKEGHESYDAILERREQLKKAGFIDYGYEIQKRAAQQNETADRKKNVLSITDKANSYIHAYAELYDEIMQGYENGTREIYVPDENGMHKLTMDEELKALDAAYKKTADDFATREKTNQHAREIIGKEMERISKISSRSTMAAAFLEEQKARGKDEIPENLNEKMYHAVERIKKQYANYNPDGNQLSQLLKSIRIF